MKCKKLAAVILVTAMTISLAACNSSSRKKDGDKNGEDSTEEKTSFISFKDADTITYIKSEIKKEATDGEVNIRLWCAGDDREFEKNLAEDFEKTFSQDGARIKITLVSKGEDEAGFKIVESPQKGADVFSFLDSHLALLTGNDAIAKVDEYYRSSVIDDNGEDSVAASTMSDSLYAFPKTCDSGYFLYYDKRYLTEDDVATFDGMIDKAASQGKCVYFNMANAWYSTGFFFTAGCDISYKFDRVETSVAEDTGTERTIKTEYGTQTATFNSPEGLSAARAMAHICEKQDKGFFSEGKNGSEFLIQGIVQGSIVAVIIGTWEGHFIKRAFGNENVGAAKLPTVLMDGVQKQLHSFGGYKLTGVNAFSKYPFASQTLAYFLTSEQSQLARYNTRGFIPTNKKAAADDKVKSDPAFKAIEEQRPYAHPQGTSVSSIYWNCGIVNLGGNIVDAKGKIDDEALRAKLKACEDKCGEGKYSI